MFNVFLLRMFLFRHAKLAVVVAVATGLLCFFLTVLFPDMPSGEAATVSASWPPVVRDLFGDPLLGFTDVHAWLHLQIFNITFWVIYGVFAAILAAGIVAGETERRTIDILLSCPIRRSSVLASQLAAVFLLLALAVLPAFAGCIAGLFALGSNVRVGNLLVTGAEGVLLSFSLAAVTLLISVFAPDQVLCASLAVAAFGLLFFVDSVLVRLIPELESYAFLNPFHFYDADGALICGAPQVLNLFALFAFGMAAAIAAALAFARRDIRC